MILIVSITKLITLFSIIVFIIYIIPFSAEATPSIPLEGRSGCKGTEKIAHMQEKMKKNAGGRAGIPSKS